MSFSENSGFRALHCYASSYHGNSWNTLLSLRSIRLGRWPPDNLGALMMQVRWKNCNRNCPLRSPTVVFPVQGSGAMVKEQERERGERCPVVTPCNNSKFQPHCKIDFNNLQTLHVQKPKCTPCHHTTLQSHTDFTLANTATSSHSPH
jgi:hypothetical protein